jgi:hypothetical protein
VLPGDPPCQARETGRRCWECACPTLELPFPRGLAGPLGQARREAPGGWKSQYNQKITSEALPPGAWHGACVCNKLHSLLRRGRVTRLLPAGIALEVER